MNPLGGGVQIGGVLGKAQGAAASPWWLAGGAPTPVAAYQPIGAASLAASYVNLANPGTYNAAPGVAPTWAAATGWTFNGSTQYLTAGIVLFGGWTVLLRFSSATLGTTANIFGASPDATNRFRFGPRTAGIIYVFGAAVATVAPAITSGVIGMAGSQPYRNGVTDGAAMAAWTGSGSIVAFIGAFNSAGSPSGYQAANVQALAIYSATLTGAQVAAVTAAMNLLA